jgi:predicted ATPase
MPKFVITGASGAGKSTLIAALAAAGYATVPEAGRQIVAEQVLAQGTALPWLDRVAFMQLLFERSVAAYDQTTSLADRTVFFDRSFIEAIAYSSLIGHPVPQEMLQTAEARRFGDPVFVCPPWREIFVTDDERRHDFEFAARDYQANVGAYRAAGYELVEIPRGSIQERVAFITGQLAHLQTFQPSNPPQKL